MEIMSKDIHSLIMDEDNEILDLPITEEEVHKVVWYLHSNKAPGPDGFSINFFRMCWSIIKVDLIRMLN